MELDQLAKWAGPASLALAAWGAALSTLLALIKLAEVWNARYQIEADLAWSSDPYEGNLLHIHNLTGRQIVFMHWKVVASRGLFRRRDRVVFAESEWNTSGLRVPAHSTHSIAFTEQDHFTPSPAFLKGRSVHLEIHAVGKGRRVRRLLPHRSPVLEALDRLWWRFFGKSDHGGMSS